VCCGRSAVRWRGLRILWLFLLRSIICRSSNRCTVAPCANTLALALRCLPASGRCGGTAVHLVSLPDHSAHHDMGVRRAVVTNTVLFPFLLMTISVLRSRSIVTRE